MYSIQKALAVVFDGGAPRGLIRGRLVSARLVLGALGLVLLAVIVSLLENVARNVSKDVGEALGWQPPGFGIVLGVVVPAAVVFLVFVLLYHYLPTTAPAGALLFSALPSRLLDTRRCNSVSAGTSPGLLSSPGFTAPRVRSSPSSFPST
jgi:uncharacterized BrkB/YihY/UPF0761 family membrane protein